VERKDTPHTGRDRSDAEARPAIVAVEIGDIFAGRAREHVEARPFAGIDLELVQFTRQLFGHGDSDHEYDILAHAINERFLQLGGDHPVPNAS
jgi:hypothetical protein